MNRDIGRGLLARTIGYGVLESLGTTEASGWGVSQAQSAGTDRNRTTLVRGCKTGDHKCSVLAFDVVDENIERIRDRIGRNIKGIVDGDWICELQCYVDGNGRCFTLARSVDQCVGKGFLPKNPRAGE